MNRTYFEQVISKENKNNVDILKKLTNGILKPAMKSLIECLTKGLDDWEYLCIVCKDNEIYASKVKIGYDGRAILGVDSLRNMLGDRFCDYLGPDEKLNLEKIDLNAFDLAAYCKIIRYRLIWGPLKSQVVLGDKNQINPLFRLLDEVLEMRILESHTSEEYISRYQDSRNLIYKIEVIIRKAAMASRCAVGNLNNGEEVSQVLGMLTKDIEEFCDAVRLAFEKQPIKPDDQGDFTVEYLYGFDRVFIAYPSCEDSELNRFIVGELSTIMTLGNSKLAVDNGTLDYIEYLMRSKNSRQAEEASVFVKLLDNDLKRIVNVIQFKKFDNEPEPVHYTDLFVSALNHMVGSVCVLTDDEMIISRRKELPKNITVVRPVDKKHITTREPEYRVLLNSESSASKIDSAKQVWRVIIPKEGSEIFYGNDLKTRYKLKNMIGEGGEGSIYETGIGRVCFKVYHEDKLNSVRQDKILNMLSMKECFGASKICWPIEGIYESSSNHVLVGFSMPDVNVISKSPVMSLEELIIFFQTGEGNGWGWNRKNLVNLAMTVVRNFKILHDQNVIVGDVNPHNILVNKDGEVYFIDTDSFQFRNFICPVGTPEYSSPRLWEEECNYRLVARNMQDEMFAEARLLFYILFLGDTPYEFENNVIDMASLKNCIINKKYRFQNKSETRDENYFWGNLSQRVKDCFENVFGSYDGKDHPEDYPTDTQWLNCLYEFTEAIDEGRLSNELIPTDAIVEEGEIWKEKICKNCNNTFRAAHNWKEDMCPACRTKKKYNKSIILRVRCRECGKQFTINLWDTVMVEHIDDKDDFVCPDCKYVACLTDDPTYEDGYSKLQGDDLKNLLGKVVKNYIKSDYGE